MILSFLSANLKVILKFVYLKKQDLKNFQDYQNQDQIRTNNYLLVKKGNPIQYKERQPNKQRSFLFYHYSKFRKK